MIEFNVHPDQIKHIINEDRHRYKTALLILKGNCEMSKIQEIYALSYAVDYKGKETLVINEGGYIYNVIHIVDVPNVFDEFIITEKDITLIGKEIVLILSEEHFETIPTRVKDSDDILYRISDGGTEWSEVRKKEK